MAQVITIRLSQALLSSTVLPEREKFMSSNATEAVTMAAIVDILHDFCGFCPNIGCGKGRLAEHQ